ncbi:MAG: hypothetical protein V7634_2548 [Bradyrhizobium sp.]|jgi:uncharacterized membrane protein YhaH (DUF805 family)
MLGFLFGFNARLGRLPYFLASLGLGVVMIVIFMAMIWAGVHANPGRIEQMMATIGWPLALMVIFFIWANFMLQAMRLRDIGWDPVCVIPLWIAIMIVDGVVATKMPEWSLTSAHKGTIVGALINLGLGVALLFFPGGDASGDDSGGRADYAPRPSSRTPVTPSQARLARVSGGDFGRRTF